MDCANGVGSEALHRLAAALEAIPGGKAAAFDMQLVNTGGGQLNDACGADFVQKDRALPVGFESLLSGGNTSSIRQAVRLCGMRRTAHTTRS